ncbi:uncharacterized protein LOC129000954 [Macrosteles quadrilineatus]|uniref:uncharacterized protein LOC129000954 n=1 Tax=Macrosteles quadrilineatus TaxID=74068 RepID=UPI0023E15701|nr:uncharacterized protein LOC129000954 [Macrosteles quadrilineatus]
MYSEGGGIVVGEASVQYSSAHSSHVTVTHKYVINAGGSVLCNSSRSVHTLYKSRTKRGRPTVLFADNGTNFQGAYSALKQIDWNEIVEYSTIKRIKWKFNPPASPCCESVINSRPLTYISEDSHDMEVLTPAMFLNGTKEYGVIDLDQINYTNLSRRWNFKLKLKEDLEKRFRSEYLSQLVLHSKKKKSHQVQVGEIVFLGSDNTKRMDWPLAKIEKILPGKDGNIRLVEIKTSKGTVLRPIQHVFPLELVQQKDNQDGNDTFEMEDEQVAEGVDREHDQPVYTQRGRKIIPPQRYLN